MSAEYWVSLRAASISNAQWLLCRTAFTFWIASLTAYLISYALVSSALPKAALSGADLAFPAKTRFKVGSAFGLLRYSGFLSL